MHIISRRSFLEAQKNCQVITVSVQTGNLKFNGNATNEANFLIKFRLLKQLASRAHKTDFLHYHNDIF